MTCLGKPLSDFCIICPENAFCGEDFAAYELQYAIFKYCDVTVPVLHTSRGAEAYEFVIGGESEAGYYTIVNEGNKISFRGTSLFGYMDAASFLREHVFRFHSDIPVGWSKKRLIFQDVFAQKTGDIRIIYQNVWGMDCPAVANRARYAAAYHLAFGADVICLNEYYGEFAKDRVLNDILEQNGYAEVKLQKEAGLCEISVEPIFYRTDRFRLLEASYVDYRMQDPSKGVAVAVLEDKTSRKRFAVACTHLAAAWDCTQAEKYLRQLKNLQFLLPELDRVCRVWGDIPVLVGGDFNCRVTTETYRKMLSCGYADARDAAAYKNDICSCHGYPTYCKELGIFVTGTLPNEALYSEGIDHVFVRNAQAVHVAMYRIMQESVVPVIADHCPQIVDIDLL